jgi:hypothetical protein
MAHRLMRALSIGYDPGISEDREVAVRGVDAGVMMIGHCDDAATGGGASCRGLRRTHADGGFGRMDALTRPNPTSHSDELGPSGGRGEDLTDALGMNGQRAQRHVSLLGRQYHLLDVCHLGGSELARALRDAQPAFARDPARILVAGATASALAIRIEHRASPESRHRSRSDQTRRGEGWTAEAGHAPRASPLCRVPGYAELAFRSHPITGDFLGRCACRLGIT